MPDAPSSDRIIVSFTLPGSASLGAFQAGAMAALAEVLLALRERDREVVVGALGGSSAGSIVSMLFAHGLLTGRDVPRLLRTAWVDEVDIGLLRNHDPDAPLAVHRLRRKMIEFLGDEDLFEPDERPIHDHPIAFQVGLTSLLGFEAPVDTGSHSEMALTYVDWSEFQLDPRHAPDRLWDDADGPSILDTVLASASHPAGFEPRVLDRSGQRDRYRENGVVGLPDSDGFWFTDGGLVESRPIGRLLSATARVCDGLEGERVHLVVDPRSSAPGGSDQWSDGEADVSWLDGLRRSVSIVPTQALHDDLREVASANRRIAALDRLLDDVLAATGCEADGDERSDVRSLVAEWSGLDDKHAVGVEMISPRWATTSDGDDVPDLLAGDFAGAFGGFLDRSIRASDFALGWRSTAAWVPHGLGRQGVDDHTIGEILGHLDAVSEPEWFEVSLDGDGVDQLSMAGRWRLTVLVAQFARVAVRAAIPTPGLPAVKLPFRRNDS